MRLSFFSVAQNTCSNEDGSSCCEVQPLQLDFRKAFGAQFRSIVWPKKVNIGTCLCTTPSTNGEFCGTKSTTAATPCKCGPTKYENFKVLLYQGQNELVLKQISGVKISECGCMWWTVSHIWTEAPPPAPCPPPSWRMTSFLWLFGIRYCVMLMCIYATVSPWVCLGQKYLSICLISGGAEVVGALRTTLLLGSPMVNKFQNSVCCRYNIEL